jgi:hypothetical protein
MVFSIDGIPSCVASSDGKPCASDKIVYSSNGPYCDDASDIATEVPDTEMFRFPTLVTPIGGDVCGNGGNNRTGVFYPECKPREQCWPDADPGQIDSNMTNMTFADIVYDTYLITEGAKCDKPQVLLHANDAGVPL